MPPRGRGRSRGRGRGRGRGQGRGRSGGRGRGSGRGASSGRGAKRGRPPKKQSDKAAKPKAKAKRRRTAAASTVGGGPHAALGSLGDGARGAAPQAEGPGWREDGLSDGWEGRQYLSADDETPRGIAKRLGVPVGEILRLNVLTYEGLTATARLMEGTLLRVPSGNQAAESSADLVSSTFVKPADIEKLLEKRSTDSGTTEYLVKIRGRSHIHCEWLATSQFDMDDTQMKFKLRRFAQNQLSEEDLEDADNHFRDCCEIERVVAARGVAADLEYLIKWESLGYNCCTWERLDDPVFSKLLSESQPQLEQYQRWSNPPSSSAANHQAAARGGVLAEVSMEFQDGNQLRPYQLEGCRWLLHCWSQGHGSILADEMGLGKTVQSVTFVECLQSQYGQHGPYLVVVPLSTMPHWLREFQAWTQMNAIVYHGDADSRQVIRQHEFRLPPGVSAPEGSPYKFNVLITTYETLLSDVGQLHPIPWTAMVVDEAHRLKNTQCSLIGALRKLKCKHRVLLTGTPLQNNTAELWSLLNFVDGTTFDSAARFNAKFGDVTNSDQVTELKKTLRPYMLRRMKDDVEKSIKSKEETLVEVELTITQKKYYRAILDKNFSVLKRGKGKSVHLGSLMNIVMELRKCCNHPFLINGVEATETADLPPTGANEASADNTLDPASELLMRASGKFILLDKLLPKLFEEGHRVLIFSQMVRLLDLLEDFMNIRRIKFERLDGNIRGALRQAAIDRFSKPGSDRNVFLLCTRAGGQGINLTAADTVIIFDSDWNPQNDIQAQARCHRIGQTKDVKVYRLLCRNTYEREMFDRASRKLGLDQAVLTSRGADKVDDKSESDRVDELLRVGAYDLFSEESEKAAEHFCEEDIDQILQRRTVVVKDDKAATTSNPFSRASFVSSESSSMDIQDPDFWDKLLPEAASAPDPLLQFGPRARKGVARFGSSTDWGMDSDEEEEEEEEEGLDNEVEGDAKGSRRWTKAERRRFQRALLSFGYGRWDDIALAASLHRTSEQIKRYARAFVARCDRLCASADDGKEAGKGTPGGSHAAKTQASWSVMNKIAKEVNAERATAEAASEEFPADPVTDTIDQEVSLLDPKFSEYLQRNGRNFLFRLEHLMHLPMFLEEVENTPTLLTSTGYLQQFPPAPWWRMPEDDVDLLKGVLLHGYGNYVRIRADLTLRFCKVCAEPGDKLSLNMNTADAGEYSLPQADTRVASQGTPPLEEKEEEEGAAVMADDSTDGAVEEWPGIRALNKRFKQLMTVVARSLKAREAKARKKYLQAAAEALRKQEREAKAAKRELKKEERRERRRLLDQEWTKREKHDFQRFLVLFGEPVISTDTTRGARTGIGNSAQGASASDDGEASAPAVERRWSEIQRRAGLGKKSLRSIETYEDLTAWFPPCADLLMLCRCQQILSPIHGAMPQGGIRG
jgi:hypothetical protein